MKAAAGASAAATTLLLAAPQVASASLIAPDSPASPQASSTNAIYWVLLIILVLAVLAVAVAFGRSLRRKSPDEGEPEAPSEASERRLQFRVGGALAVVAVALFVAGIFFTNAATSVDADQSDASPIKIKVDGQQWLWRYGYPADPQPADGFSPDAAYSYYELVIPVDTPITLDVGSIDVMHRLSIPALGVAVDAVPGVRTKAEFVADDVGVYEGRSTRFSGGGFPTMRTIVRVVDQAEYEEFLRTRSEEIKQAREAVYERMQAGEAPGVEVEVEE